MAPSAPKTGYCQADFFAQLFQKNRFLGGPGKRACGRLVLVIFGTRFGTPLLHCLIDGMKPGAIALVDLKLFLSHTDRHQTNKRAQVI